MAPLLAISESRATRVHCYGSGYMRPELQTRYGNPYPIETAIVRLDKENLSAEVTRSLFHTVRSYMESFNLYGDKASFEWHMENEYPVLFTVANGAGPYQEKDIVAKRVVPPDYGHLLPPEIARYSSYERVSDPSNPLQFVKQGGGHHGSHPHMVHEFLRSIVEEREPWISAHRAANWTAVGICAHQSALAEGAEVTIPDFE